MRVALFSAAFCAALSLGASAALAQATEDNVASGGQFPLAAPAGQDSGAREKAPAGAVNQGAYDMTKWKYGPRYNPPAGGSQIWNPVKAKMMAGGKVTAGTVFFANTPQTYCAMANAGYDFIWTEMQHSPHTWQAVANMWAACPHARAVPGVRVPNANEFDEQHALDEGALVLVVPTIRSLAEGKEAAKWAFWPPMGQRSAGGGQAFTPEFWGNVPGGYRQTFNDNLVLILMIETLDGLKDADKIAKIPGVSALFAASSDLGNFAGYRQGDPDYEREINIVHDAALKAHVRLCGPLAWRDRPDFTCFQAPTEDTAITLGVHQQLGDLWNTQGKVSVGPYANMPPPPRMH